MNNNIYETFTNLYPVSKTLRFELIPQKKTLEHIREKGLIQEDILRAEDYKEIKTIIDEYHKSFIDETLEGISLEYLEEYYHLYRKTNKEDKDKKLIDDYEKKLRKQISQRLKDAPKFKTLFSKELIKKDLLEYVDDEVQKELIKKFSNFTTYFTGFHDNRKNMYSEEDKSSAISYRVINENLPKFIDNIKAFERLKKPLMPQLEIVKDELELILQVNEIEEIFEIDYFTQTVTQRGIDVYNQVIGGYVDGDKNYKGINQHINEFNQKNKGDKLPQLKPLFKQILSDRKSISFVPEQIKSDDELLKSIDLFWDETEDIIVRQKNLLSDLNKYDYKHLYIKNDASITKISKQLFGDWSKIQSVLDHEYDKNFTGKRKDEEKYLEVRKKYFKAKGSFSLEEINCALKIISEEINIDNYYAKEIIAELFDNIKKAALKYKTLDINTKEKKALIQNQKSIDIIKAFLDSILDWQHFIKPILGTGTEPEKDAVFYGEFDQLWEKLAVVTLLYNRVRNYLTQKPYSTEKIKLNFENSTLLSGWDVNKEPDNTAVILLKNGQYYLGIMNKKHNRIFKEIESIDEANCYKKMEYKLLPGANKMLPKVFFSKSRLDEFAPSSKILEIYEKGSYKKGDSFNIKDCHALIDFFKASINKHEDWKKFDFKFSETESYEDISYFYREVEQQGYKIKYKNIPEKTIDQLVDKGYLYLFQIYNKDFSSNKKSKGKDNLHTLYWKMLFDERNLKNAIYKLNGEAEVFYRPASLNDPVTHKANEVIKNKNPNNAKRESLFDYDIIKDRRYTKDKFFFHVPITLNFNCKGIDKINEHVNKCIHNSDEIYSIGIDRGERHLLYYSVVNGKGEIVEQGTLNSIKTEVKGTEYATDYWRLLDEKEKGRNQARKNWSEIENIKELKDGYMSQVVHKLVKLMIKYNAILVLEDLNAGFMRGRQKVEKQVYQKFERKLIEKLNYLVDKDIESEEPGGLLKAYQLTNQFDSFKNLGKQSGFLYYVPAWNTSKMDPTTGFVNLFSLKYVNQEETKRFFSNFKSINYNEENDYFEFDFDYNDFTYKAQGTKTIWTVCTFGERIVAFRNSQKNNEWDYKYVRLSEEFKQLLRSAGIDYTCGQLKEKILDINESAFYKELLYLFKLTLQMRNSDKDRDYLISPVRNKEGVFFNSENSDERWPDNADANGAYNIARKGQWIVETLRATAENQLKKPNLTMTNKEWLNYAQR